MSLRLGLLGHPVAHSLSPVIHRAALAASGLDGQYSLFDLPSEDSLDVYFTGLREGRWDGLNVTLPYKRAAALRCDALVGDAAALGVVNTLVPDAGRVVGHNSDVPGLVRAVRRRWPGFVPEVVTVLGAGGAARAAVLAAARLGARVVRVWNRTHDNALVLAEALGGVVHVDVRVDARDACAGAELVLQSGSGEMGLGVGTEAWEGAVARASAALAECEGRVVDLVYKPRRTAWVEAATRRGLEADDGLAMLVMQAAVAFELWTGAHVSVEPLLAAVS